MYNISNFSFQNVSRTAFHLVSEYPNESSALVMGGIFARVFSPPKAATLTLGNIMAFNITPYFTEENFINTLIFCDLETFSELRLGRVFGSFEPRFWPQIVGIISPQILPLQFESKIDQNNPKTRPSLNSEKVSY